MDCVAASREYDKGDKSIGSVFARDISVNDAREAIVGRQEFREYDAGDASIFTYYLGQSKDDNMFPNPEKAPDEITRRRWLVRRECRGLVFSKGQGNELLSRRLHKFHNIGEVPDETSVECIDFSQPFVATVSCCCWLVWFGLVVTMMNSQKNNATKRKSLMVR